MNSNRQDHTAAIRTGQALVRSIDASLLLIALEEDDRARRTLEQMNLLCQAQLRQLVEPLPAHVTAQIMAVSAKQVRPVAALGLN